MISVRYFNYVFRDGVDFYLVYFNNFFMKNVYNDNKFICNNFFM